MSKRVTLHWVRSRLMTEARHVVGARSCVYVQTDRRGRPVRVGKASRGLHVRYRGGTGWALDATMHESGNLVYTALSCPSDCVRQSKITSFGIGGTRCHTTSWAS
jgi:hypothetical protein